MIQDVIDKIKNDLTDTFNNVDVWFNSEDVLLDYLPQNGGWTIRQILEHISLTNHYLLILIRKGIAKSIEKSRIMDYSNLLQGYDLDWEKMRMIGEHNSFAWNRPEHMEPKADLALNAIRIKLNQQAKDCLSLLNQVPNGEGVLYKTKMSVNDLGKIDVYHYIYFLIQHAKRHLTQMNKVKMEFEKKD